MRYIECDICGTRMSIHNDNRYEFELTGPNGIDIVVGAQLLKRDSLGLVPRDLCTNCRRVVFNTTPGQFRDVVAVKE